MDFINKIDKDLYDNIVLLDRKDSEVQMNDEFYLGFGSYETELTTYLPIVRFLQTGNNQSLCKGIIGSGNMNLGPEFLITPKRISREFNLPIVAGFEIGGTHKDVEEFEIFLSNQIDGMKG